MLQSKDCKQSCNSKLNTHAKIYNQFYRCHYQHILSLIEWVFYDCYIDFTNMEAERPLQALPRRQYNIPVKLPNSHKKQVVTNYFDIRIGRKTNHIYQFMFESQPQIPQDSNDLLYNLVKSMKKQLKQTIGFITSSGQMIWGTMSLSTALLIKTQFIYKEAVYKYEVIIKQTKALDIQNLLQNKDGAKMVFQIFNNKIKNAIRDKKMDQVTRGKFFDKKDTKIQQIGLNIIRGFKFTLCPLKSGLTLQIDVCSKIFRSANLLEEINRMPKNTIQTCLVGKIVITRYGKIKTYTIEKFDFTKTPKSQFSHNDGTKITYAQYYKKAYGLNIKEMNQPLIQVIQKTQKKMKSNGEIVQEETRIFLIPQFVSLTGMSDEQRSNFEVMKRIAPYTKLTPDERLKITDKFIKELKNEDFEVGMPKKVFGYQLQDPKVQLAGATFTAKDGSLNFRDKIKQPVKFHDWVVVYSYGKNPSSDDNQADNFVNLVIQSAKTFGIQFSQPGFITCEPNINSWRTQIQKDLSKNGKPITIVLLLNPSEEKFYGQLKRYITCDLMLPSQAIRKRTVGNKAKNAMSAASKIIMQMNQKVGGVSWQVNKNNAFDKKRTMYGAFSLSKGKSGFTLAFVGTLNTQNTKVYNYCKIGFKRKEQIPQAEFYQIFLNWAKSYVKQNKQGPDSIIIYREGLSLPQIQVQTRAEYSALQRVIQKIGEKTKKAKYRPEVLYLTVNKKINARIFDTGSSLVSQGKFIPKVFNPTSGTVVFDQLSVDNLYDFHLVAQKVTQGTCTPTQYIVIKNDSKLSQQSLAQFTYDQCFNYYNWQGAVKVPACLQCANKLAKLVGESIQKSVTDGEVTKGFYFL